MCSSVKVTAQAMRRPCPKTGRVGIGSSSSPSRHHRIAHANEAAKRGAGPPASLPSAARGRAVAGGFGLCSAGAGCWGCAEGRRPAVMDRGGAGWVDEGRRTRPGRVLNCYSHGETLFREIYIQHLSATCLWYSKYYLIYISLYVLIATSEKTGNTDGDKHSELKLYHLQAKMKERCLFCSWQKGGRYF